MSPTVSPAPSARPSGPPSAAKEKAPIWWSNASFFIGMHVLAVVGVVKLSPWRDLDLRTCWMCIASWQLATFGITIGYHRCWSHRAFVASFPLRCVLAGMGCLGFQGSIKWWVLRHRLHHRFTDTDSDPYNANEGLYHSHVGWIFRKPNYPRMALIDRKDLDIDPVVRFQHKYYVPLTLGLGLGLPTLIGWSYGDAMGGYVWGGVVARIMIWHFTFFINSLAHYVGEQAYSEDLSARGNFFLALFTGGEANHNYHHAFPKDYRNGVRTLDWDPTKWIIYALHHYTPLVPKVFQTPESEILKAQAHVLSTRSDAAELNEPSHTSTFAKWSSYASDGSASSASDGSSSSTDEYSSDGDEVVAASLSGATLRSRSTQTHRRVPLPTWTTSILLSNLAQMDLQADKGTDASSRRRPLLLKLDGYAVDITHYAAEHPGGLAYMREYSINPREGKNVKDATHAFGGGMNDHGWNAVSKMESLRIARIVD